MGMQNEVEMKKGVGNFQLISNLVCPTQKLIYLFLSSTQLVVGVVVVVVVAFLFTVGIVVVLVLVLQTNTKNTTLISINPHHPTAPSQTS